MTALMSVLLLSRSASTAGSSGCCGCPAAAPAATAAVFMLQMEEHKKQASTEHSHNCTRRLAHDICLHSGHPSIHDICLHSGHPSIHDMPAFRTSLYS
eukprot:1017684-Pelagomonas_calceolata.AAC.8